jgi:GT2 family glycosyltransferase
LPEQTAIVVIPTLAADEKLTACLAALEQQTRNDFFVVVVDNSGRGSLRGLATGGRVGVFENRRNAGFGAAVNAGMSGSLAPYIAVLNDDAVPHPGWLDASIRALESRPDAGMVASQVRLFGEDTLDSAGMLVARDGSSKQRGHGRQPADFPVLEEVLCPSGSAALYRAAMIHQIGGFDERFFLYCEDTDLGLRARRAGWTCLYEPRAVAEHHYSHSAGRASPLKAYYVERNRLFLLVKNFPAGRLALAPFYALARYLWHLWYMMSGQGSAARFRAEGNPPLGMVWCVLKAHAALLRNLPWLWRERKAIRAGARVTPRVFAHQLDLYRISTGKVAAQ